MKALFPCLALAALGHAVYHMGQKSMPASVNPMALLMGGYAVAFLLATLAMPFFRAPGDAIWTAPAFNLPVLVLGVGAVLIELGFPPDLSPGRGTPVDRRGRERPVGPHPGARGDRLFQGRPLRGPSPGCGHDPGGAGAGGEEIT